MQTTAARHPQAIIDLIDIGIELPNGHVTQNAAQRPRGCDAPHDLAMFFPSRVPAARSCPGFAFCAGLAAALRLTAPQRMCTVLGYADAKAYKAESPTFETAMRDLEELVARLEHGDLPLEESLAAFERGVMLTRACQSALKEAEQKVEILLKKAGEAAIEDFTPTNSKAADRERECGCHGGTDARLSNARASRP